MRGVRNIMEWALAFLFIFSTILLIFSFYKMKHASKAEQRAIDTVYMGMMEEINKLQEKVRNLELEGEILAHHSSFAKEELNLRSKLLDLYRRNYSLEGIASKMQLEQEEVEQRLAPFMSVKNERSIAKNEA